MGWLSARRECSRTQAWQAVSNGQNEIFLFVFLSFGNRATFSPVFWTYTLRNPSRSSRRAQCTAPLREPLELICSSQHPASWSPAGEGEPKKEKKEQKGDRAAGEAIENPSEAGSQKCEVTVGAPAPSLIS